MPPIYLAPFLLYALLILTLRMGDKMNIPLALGFVALFSGGLGFFLGKVGISNGVYIPPWIVLIALIHILAALAFHAIQKEPFVLSPRMMGLGGMAGLFAATSYFATLFALKMGGHGSLIFPLVGLGVMVAVPLSFIFHNEPVTTTKLLGLVFGVTAIIFLSR